MGGLFSTPSAPVQSNEAQLMLVREQAKQNELLYKQAQQTAEQQRQADEAAAEQKRMLDLREAEAEKERQEREQRIAKGKRDLLYRNALGVQQDDEESLFKLGGA